VPKRREWENEFPGHVKTAVRTIQKNHSIISVDLPIVQFHHDPPRRDLLQIGVVPEQINYCRGVHPIDHAFLHKCEYLAWGDPGDNNAYQGLRGEIGDPAQIARLDKMLADKVLVSEFVGRARGRSIKR